MTEHNTKKIFEANHTATQARWIYIALVFAIGVITKVSGVSNVKFPKQLVAGLFLLAIANNSFWYVFRWLRPEKNHQNAQILYRTTFLQYVVDLSITTIVIHFAGGIESISFIFFFFVIVSSSFIYGQGGVFAISLGAIFLYNALIYAEYFQLISTYPRYIFSDLTVHHSLDAVAVNTFTVSMVLLTTALFIGYLSRLRKMQEERILEEKDEKIRETKKTEEIRSRFITVLTHQLRTPLTHIKLALANFSESGEVAAEPGQKLLADASFSVERILALVDRLVKIKDLETIKEHFDKDKIISNSI